MKDPTRDRTANLARIRAAVRQVGARPGFRELPNRKGMGDLTVGPLGLVSEADERRLRREDESMAAEFYAEVEE